MGGTPSRISSGTNQRPASFGARFDGHGPHSGARARGVPLPRGERPAQRDDQRSFERLTLARPVSIQLAAGPRSEHGTPGDQSTHRHASFAGVGAGATSSAILQDHRRPSAGGSALSKAGSRERGNGRNALGGDR